MIKLPDNNEFVTNEKTREVYEAACDVVNSVDAVYGEETLQNRRE